MHSECVSDWIERQMCCVKEQGKTYSHNSWIVFFFYYLFILKPRLLRKGGVVDEGIVVLVHNMRDQLSFYLHPVLTR